MMMMMTLMMMNLMLMLNRKKVGGKGGGAKAKPKFKSYAEARKDREKFRKKLVSCPLCDQAHAQWSVCALHILTMHMHRLS